MRVSCNKVWCKWNCNGHQCVSSRISKLKNIKKLKEFYKSESYRKLRESGDKMEFNIMTECIACNEIKLCNEIPTEHEGKQMVICFCKECEEEITEISKWAEEYTLKYGCEENV